MTLETYEPISGFYVLLITCNYATHDDLYCKNTIEIEIVGCNRSECIKDARSFGWLLNPKKGKALCPKCSGKTPTYKGGETITIGIDTLEETCVDAPSTYKLYTSPRGIVSVSVAFTADQVKEELGEVDTESLRGLAVDGTITHEKYIIKRVT